MATTIAKRKARNAAAQRHRTEGKAGPVPEADSDELPSREALVAHLERQRAELLHAMWCVDVARRTIEQHAAKPPLEGQPQVSHEQHEFYRARVLETLHEAAEALRTAYPMLERIAHALAVEEILKQHVPPVEATAPENG